MKHDIFISYRRDGGFEIANLIASKLKIAGYRVFLDIHAMHAGDFSSQLEDKVKRCKDFIWILSANSESKTLYYKNGIDYYRDELCWAIEHKRNIIRKPPAKYVFFATSSTSIFVLKNEIYDDTRRSCRNYYVLQGTQGNL